MRNRGDEGALIEESCCANYFGANFRVAIIDVVAKDFGKDFDRDCASVFCGFACGADRFTTSIPVLELDHLEDGICIGLPQSFERPQGWDVALNGELFQASG